MFEFTQAHKDELKKLIVNELSSMIEDGNTRGDVFECAWENMSFDNQLGEDDEPELSRISDEIYDGVVNDFLKYLEAVKLKG